MSNNNKRSQPPVRGSSVQPQTNRPSLSQYQQHQSHDYHNASNYSNLPAQQRNAPFLNRSTTTMMTNPSGGSGSGPSMGPTPQQLQQHQQQQRAFQNSTSGVNSQQAQMIADFANSKHKFSSFNSLSSMYDQPSSGPGLPIGGHNPALHGPLNVNAIRNMYLYNTTGGGGGGPGGGGGGGVYLRQMPSLNQLHQHHHHQQQQQQSMNLTGNHGLVPTVCF